MRLVYTGRRDRKKRHTELRFAAVCKEDAQHAVLRGRARYSDALPICRASRYFGRTRESEVRVCEAGQHRGEHEAYRETYGRFI